MSSEKNSTEKLQKVLARAGLGSRREIERWIAAGRIAINGKKATIGDRVSPNAKITLDGRSVKLPTQKQLTTRVLLYNKPEGVVCTRSDPEKRSTVFDHLPPLKKGRWIMVGRLDINSSGLMIFTNDGELAHRLMHPSSEIEREYAARIFGEVNEEMKIRLLKGVKLEDGVARFAKIELSGGEGINSWYHVIVKEGRNRLVRRLWESQGVRVNRLNRVRIDELILKRSLRPKQWVELAATDVDYLKKRVKIIQKAP